MCRETEVLQQKMLEERQREFEEESFKASRSLTIPTYVNRCVGSVSCLPTDPHVTFVIFLQGAWAPIPAAVWGQSSCGLRA